jgi:biotin synthase
MILRRISADEAGSMNYSELADLALAGGELTDEQAYAVLRAPDADVLPILEAAFRLRRHYFGLDVQIHVLTNAKSGLCPEDCHYCSQSSVSDAPVARYSFLQAERLLEEAKRAKAAKAMRYCIVNSGRGPTDGEIDQITKAVRLIKSETGLDICCSLGLIGADQAARLKEAGVDRINHNLNTSERFHPEICTTHTYKDRLDTLKTCKEAGLELCSGAIFGQGETDEDIIAVARACREIGQDSIPINFLIPIAGTPFEGRAQDLTPTRCLRILSLMRFINPDREIRVAGGRELHLKTLQPMALYAANSIFVTGYLTEPGQDAPDAWKMIEDLGFRMVQPAPETTPAQLAEV